MPYRIYKPDVSNVRRQYACAPMESCACSNGRQYVKPAVTSCTERSL